MSDEKAAKVAAWKQAIETQMHFNDLSVRSRQLGLTFVVAALGFSVVVVIQFPDAGMFAFGHFFHASGILMLACILAVLAVRTLDLGVYHRMLRGSVAFQEAADALGMAKELFGMPDGMTKYISTYSRHEDASYDAATGALNTPTGNSRKAANKVQIFYLSVIAFLVIFSIIIFILVPPPDQLTSQNIDTQTELDANAQ